MSCQPQSLSSKSQVKGVPSTGECRRYPEGGQMGCQGRFGATLATCAHPRELHPPRGAAPTQGTCGQPVGPAHSLGSCSHLADSPAPRQPVLTLDTCPVDLHPPILGEPAPILGTSITPETCTHDTPTT